MAGADEADFLELLVANNRINEWVERIRARGNPARQKQALLLLKQAVESRSAYAEEARQAGVVPLLTRLLGLTDDEEVLDASSAVIAACSGPGATAGKVSSFTYDDAVVHIREGALGDGLGAKVWMVAHMLCLELAANRGLVAGRRVLELGSGCGVCGLAAAALGAEHVVLSDVEGPVLRNLRSCMHMNYSKRLEAAKEGAGSGARGTVDAAEGCGTTTHTQRAHTQQTGGGPRAGTALPSEVELFDEADEVEDFDDLMSDMMAVDGGGGCPVARGSRLAAAPSVSGSSGGCGAGAQGQQPGPHHGDENAWEVGNTSVRLLDWGESRALLDSGAPLEDLGQDPGPQAAASSVSEDLPPRVPVSERFPVIVGSEVMYERIHAELVAAVVKHRLAPGGCAVLHCAVRELKVFEHFARECRRRGLRYRHRQVDPATAFGGSGNGCCPFEGILGRADEYEGGVLLMALDHEDSPCMDWYRDDWEPSPANSAAV